MKRLVLALTLFLQAGIASANQPGGGWQCWAEASAKYNVPVDLLYAIARVETGNRTGVVSRSNKNGTYDIGLMQINSSHLPRLARMGITERELLRNPCVNLHVGAMILSEMIAIHGYTWVAIGAYNAGSHDKRAAYAKKVFAMYDKIIRERNGRPTTIAEREKERRAALEYQRRLAELHKRIQIERQRIAMLEAETSQGDSN